jgi:hypothetical protein
MHELTHAANCMVSEEPKGQRRMAVAYMKNEQFLGRKLPLWHDFY